MNKLFFIISVILLTKITRNNEILSENLNGDTFNDFIKNNEFSLVEFHMNGCRHCLSFEPVISEVAKKVKSLNINIKLGKIEGNENIEISNQEGVRGFPTLKFYSKSGMNCEYRGDMEDVESIMEYIHYKMNKKIIEITNLTEFIELENKEKIFVLICKGTNSNITLFREIDQDLKNYDNLDTYFTENEEVKAELNCSKDNLDLFVINKFYEDRLQYNLENFEKKNFSEFIKSNTLPPISELSDELFERVSSGIIPGIILLSEPENKGIFEIMSSIAKSFRNKAIILQTSQKQDIIERLFESQPEIIDKSPLIVALFSKEGAHLQKYKYEIEDFTQEKIENWIELFLDGKLN